MTEKNYQFVKCPVVYSFDRCASISADTLAAFGDHSEGERMPVLVKRPSSFGLYGGAKAYLFSTEYINHFNKIVLECAKDTDSEEWKQKLAAYEGVKEVEVMLLDEDDLEKYFLNVDTTNL